MSKKPNILLIVSDQHRWDCLGAYGNNQVKTPAIDALASGGTRFSNAFTSCPICTPARYSLLTGQYVHQHLGWDNHCTIPSGIPTFPKLLKQSGYRTAAVGKMHYTPAYLDVGFSKMSLAEQFGPARFEDDYHRWLLERGQCDAIDLMDQSEIGRDRLPDRYWDTYGAIESNLDEAHHSTTWTADQALTEMNQWGDDGGNLLMVGFIKPHHPFDPPRPWSRMYDPDDLAPLPGWTDVCLQRDLAYRENHFSYESMTPQQYRRVLAFYYATISQIDHHVGRMTELLKRKGLYDNTLIIYTSDHGDYMGHHHMLLKGNYCYDPVVKVPLIMKPSGDCRAGRTDDNLTSIVDLAPTILASAGVEVSQPMEGHNLLDEPVRRRYVFSECLWGSLEYMVRSRTHKLLLCEDDRHSQFYDIESDPHELTNLYSNAAYAEQITRMREALNSWLQFETPSRIYLDQSAPVVKRVPRGGEVSIDHEQVEAYFRHQYAKHKTAAVAPSGSDLDLGGK